MEAIAQLVAVCDGCGARYRVAVEHAGKRLKCRKCGLIVSVPAEGAEPEPAPKSPVSRSVPARMPAAAPKSRRAAGSIRERADQKRGAAHFGPMHYVVVVAVLFVAVLYLMLGR